MNTRVGPARIGQWYARADKGEVFQVTGLDAKAGTIEIQSFDGDLDEIDEETWAELPVELAEAPEDWTGPMDDVEVDDLGYTDTAMRGPDWTEPLTPFHGAAARQEAWEDETPAYESNPEEEKAAVNDLALGQPIESRPLG